MDLILIAVLLGIGGLFALIGFVVWTFRDVIFYAVDVLGYLLQAVAKVTVLGAVALLDVIDDWYDEGNVTADPLFRALVIGSVGFLLGVGMVVLLATFLGQPWVILTLLLAVLLGMVVGLLADPEKDWSLGAFPRLSRRDRGGPQLPLNL